MNIDVVVEIPRNTNIKYEWDFENNRLRVDRIINCPFSYPDHYGYVPGTKAEDGDCLDVVLVSELDLIPGCIIQSKIIGILFMEDEKGLDHKIIAVPNDSVDKKSKNINKLSDIDSLHLNKIKYFFNHYKDLEEGKWSKVMSWGDIDEAINIKDKSILI